MPKLLIINITCNQGSTGKISEQIGVLMKEQGWDVYYAHGARRVNSSKLKTILVGSKMSEYIHALKGRLFDAEGYGSTKATRSLIYEIKKISPDIVHVHNVHGYYLNFTLLFNCLKEMHIPVVWTLHDCWSFTGRCAYFDYPKCDKWKDGCGNCSFLSKYPSTLWIDRSGKHYEDKVRTFSGFDYLHLVPVSEWLSSLIKQSFLSVCPIHVFHNGIDLSVFHPYPKKSDAFFEILAVSNIWDERKGLDDIVSLRSLLSDEYKITVVGLTKKQIKNLPMGIKGIASTNSQSDLAKLYSQADVLINPTYEDNFPTVNLEALACGTPVITYNTGGSPEAIDIKTGVIIDKGDVEAMAEEIIKMKNSPLSSNDCRDRALRFFDKNECFKAYVLLFKKILSERNLL